jgi:hypothetical protein
MANDAFRKEVFHVGWIAAALAIDPMKARDWPGGRRGEGRSAQARDIAFPRLQQGRLIRNGRKIRQGYPSQNCQVGLAPAG